MISDIRIFLFSLYLGIIHSSFSNSSPSFDLTVTALLFGSSAVYFLYFFGLAFLCSVLVYWIYEYMILTHSFRVLLLPLGCTIRVAMLYVVLDTYLVSILGSASEYV